MEDSRPLNNAELNIELERIVSDLKKIKKRISMGSLEGVGMVWIIDDCLNGLNDICNLLEK
jgi:hypothetical protein